MRKVCVCCKARNDELQRVFVFPLMFPLCVEMWKGEGAGEGGGGRPFRDWIATPQHPAIPSPSSARRACKSRDRQRREKNEKRERKEKMDQIKRLSCTASSMTVTIHTAHVPVGKEQRGMLIVRCDQLLLLPNLMDHHGHGLPDTERAKSSFLDAKPFRFGYGVQPPPSCARGKSRRRLRLLC